MKFTKRGNILNKIIKKKRRETDTTDTQSELKRELTDQFKKIKSDCGGNKHCIEKTQTLQKIGLE